MITLHKQARFHPNSDKDLWVGNLNIFRESDFYCKSRQTNKLPETHEFDERVIEAYEFLFQVFSLKFGEQAKPNFSSTLRLEGDPNFRTSAGWLSYHSKARAADGNWNQHSQDIEDFIVCAVGYDIEKEGFIFQKLRSIGIGGFGTYYREAEGTFIHLDTRESFIHFRKIKRYKLWKAGKWHREIEKLWKENQLEQSIEIPDFTPNETFNETIIFSADFLSDLVNLNRKTGEDPVSESYLKGKNAILVLGSILLIGIAFWLIQKGKINL